MWQRRYEAEGAPFFGHWIFRRGTRQAHSLIIQESAQDLIRLKDKTFSLFNGDGVHKTYSIRLGEGESGSTWTYLSTAREPHILQPKRISEARQVKFTRRDLRRCLEGTHGSIVAARHKTKHPAATQGARCWALATVSCSPCAPLGC